MAPSTSMVGRLGFALLAATALVQPALAQTEQKYCSSKNTADGQGTPSIYQSVGLCKEQCIKTHAFAVLTDNLCWCSNYIPGDTVDREECNSPCKGYDKENCGGPDLYGYVRLNLLPSGTKGAPASTSSKKEDEPKTVTATAPGETITVTPTPPASSSTTPPTTSSTSSSETSTSSSTTSPSKTSSSTTSPSTTKPPSSTSTNSDAEETEVFASTVTESGEERIITVIPTQAAPIETNKKSQDEDGGGGGSKLSTGAAVGLTIGLVALACIVGGIIFLIMRKKRKDRDAEAIRSSSPGAPNSGIPSRTMSENSRYMLGTDGRSQVVGGWDQEGDMTQSGNRRSRLMPVDPRLDPFAPVYQRGDGAHSRESVMSVRDDMDYSRRVVGGPVIAGGSSSPPRRVLGVVNPS